MLYYSENSLTQTTEVVLSQFLPKEPYKIWVILAELLQTYP